MRKIALLAPLVIAACTQVAAVEQKAAPIITQACAQFHAAEANPLVQIALAVGGAATGAGATVTAVKSFGDAFCSAGPPAGDTTTPEQQVAWLADVTAKMLAAAGAK